MSDKTLMHYILSGDVYATKKGGKWIVDRESIDLFMLADDMHVKVALAKARGII